ncbi:GNAT family N-acetyltransferase [Sutcliffiella horikoshii]|uniref:GNAT family N-acetyltransferase n=1 Tax=Sutcliffiella horikoshii TaxID=79883 RepID=UPI001F3BC4F3|nr:GNAT family N-acetyltransferase [Sutcliffiella horikoshii]MCG1023487.1 GNAT family N-acetyltransferase [Sutcliffiella horikoshii]
MEIYQATSKDLEGVSQLFNKYRIFYKQISDLEGAKTFIKSRLENEDSVIFVAKISDEDVGFTQLYPTFSSISMKSAWILNDMFVDAKARNQGVGEKLLQKAQDFARETDAKSITLETTPDNEGAQRLYERNGYKKDEEFYHYYLELKE